ncbi:MAG: hypothetical protein EHM64_09260 [Ignavibacteriae bacterium]|nr:MAG: hypothetical protein EHM64_09260 [Ignavibacteriota bacterium]
MATIEIYTDDTKCNRNTFRIIVVIWGEKENCDSYKKDIQYLVNANIKVLGKDFKGFHSYNLNEKNWKTVGKAYEQVLDYFIESVKNKKLHFFIRLESEDVYNANAGYLKNLAKVNLEKRESDFGKIFKKLSDKDLPAFYHRADQLFIFLRYRDKFGSSENNFILYPDSSGKILRYDGTTFEVSGDIFKEYPIEFYDLIKIWCNSLTKIIKAEEWPSGEQRLDKFCPLKSSGDYIIQTCDIISNFFFNFLRNQVGILDPKAVLKTNALCKIIDFSQHSGIIKSSFIKKEDEVICSVKGLKVYIDFV